MVVKTDPIVSEIIIDTSSVKQADAQIRKFARDTKAELDPKIQIELETNVVSIENQIRDVKDALRDPELTEPERIELRIGLNRLKSNLTEAKRQLQNYRNTWDKELSRLQKKFNDTNDTIKQQWGVIWSLKRSLSWIWWLIAWAFALDQIIEFWRRIFTVTSRVESARTAFIQLTWSVDQANALLAEIDEFAQRSPFNRLGIQEAAQRLLWFQFTAAETVDVLQAVGEGVAAIGGNQETFDGVVLALWQIQAKGKVSAEELLQIAERWLPVFDILTEKLGLTQEEIANIWNAWITAEQWISALVEWLNERFGGALEAQSLTLQGRLSNLVDIFEIRLWQLWSSLSWWFNKVLDTLSRALNSFTESDIVEFGQSLSLTFSAVFDSLIFLVESTFSVIRTSVQWLNDLFAFVANWFNTSAQQIENAKQSSLWLFSLFTLWITTVWQAFQLLTAIVTDVAKWFPQIFAVSASNIGKIFSNLSGIVIEEIVSIVNWAIWLLNSFAEQANTILPESLSLWTIDTVSFSSWVASLTDWLEDFWDSFAETEKKAAWFFQNIENARKDLLSQQWGVNVFELFGDWIAPTSPTSPTWPSGSQEEINRNKELEESIRKIQEAREEERRAAIGTLWWVSNLLTDQVRKYAEIRDEIAGIDEEIQWINSSIENVNLSAAEDLASRFVEIQNEIANIDVAWWDSWDQARLQALQAEAELIKQNTTEAQLAEAERQAWLSTAEKILEARDQEISQLEIKRQELEDQKALLEEQKAAEIETIRQSAELQKSIEEGITENFRIQIEKRKEILSDFQRLQGQAADLWLISASQNAWWGAWWINNTSTQNINVTVDWVSNPDEVKRAVNEAIVESSRSSARSWF